MSDTGAKPNDVSAALGTATSELARAGTGWLLGQPPIAVFSIVVMVCVVGAVYWGLTSLIPNHIDRINAGYKAQSDAFDVSLTKILTASEKAQVQQRDENTRMIAANAAQNEALIKHNEKLIEYIREDRKPIAVNPLPMVGGS